MLYLGIILCIYAIFAIWQILKGWKSLKLFFAQILDTISGCIGSATEVLPPLRTAASATRSGSENLVKAIDQIELDVPNVLKAVIAEAESFSKDLHRHSLELKDHFSKVEGSLKEIGAIPQDVFDNSLEPAITASSRAIGTSRMAIVEPDWFTFTQAVADRLTQEDNPEKVPTEIISALNPILELRFPSKDLFEEKLKNILGDANFVAHGDKIIKASRNPNYRKDIVGTLEGLSRTLYVEGQNDTIHGDMLAMASTINDSSIGITIFLGIMAGVGAPLGLALKALAGNALIVARLFENINIKIPAGKLYSKRLRLPDVGINLRFTIMPEGVIKFEYPGGFDITSGIDWDTFSWPGNDRLFSREIIAPGKIFDQRLAIPPVDISIFDGEGVVDRLEDVDQWADRLINSPADVPKAYQGLKNTAERLTGTAERFVSLADSIFGVSEKFVSLGPELDQIQFSIEEVKKSVKESIADLKEGTERLVASMNDGAATTIKALNDMIGHTDSLIETVRSIDLTPTLGFLRVVAGEVETIAQNIDHPNKEGIVQKIETLLSKVKLGTPSQSMLEAVVKPVFLVIFALHVLILLIGAWLIYTEI